MKRSEQREQNIQRVICVAQSLFIADGIAATPISRIAEAAGLTPTSLYRYFRNKDALVFAAWRDALATFFSDFMAQYTREAASCKNGYEKFVVCMHIYFRTYDRRPEWYDYTREMFSAYSEKGTGNDVNNVFWKYYDREIPVPALKALREGVADGSIRPDVNIYAVYQCLLNAYTGTTIYENLSFGVSPVARSHCCRSSAAAAACSTRSTAQSRATQCPSCRRAVMPCLPISTSLRCVRFAPRPRSWSSFCAALRRAMYRRCSITLSIISSTRCAAASRASCLKKPMHTLRTALRASRTRRSRTTSVRPERSSAESLRVCARWDCCRPAAGRSTCSTAPHSRVWPIYRQFFLRFHRWQGCLEA